MTGRELKLLRQSKDIKQNTIADLLNVTQSYISRFEKNERSMKQHNIEKYKKFIDEYIVD